MPDTEDFDALLESDPEPGGVLQGMPGGIGARINSEDGSFEIGHSKIHGGGGQSAIRGPIQVDGAHSISYNLLGTPLAVVDNPLNIMPSTLFTPIASKLPFVDLSYLELAMIGFVLVSLALPSSGTGVSNG